MPNTSDTFALRALTEHALAGTSIAANDGGVVWRMCHTSDTFTLQTLTKHAWSSGLTGAIIRTDNTAVILSVTGAPHTFKLCTFTEDADFARV